MYYFNVETPPSQLLGNAYPIELKDIYSFEEKLHNIHISEIIIRNYYMYLEIRMISTKDFSLN